MSSLLGKLVGEGYTNFKNYLKNTKNIEYSKDADDTLDALDVFIDKHEKEYPNDKDNAKNKSDFKKNEKDSLLYYYSLAIDIYNIILEY
jgi:hypothetical protein